MSIVLLRTLTPKSIIGFGNYKDLTVQNLLDMRNHKALLEIYYFFRNIDFNQPLLEELCITNERIIDKKIKQEERTKKEYYFYIRLCLRDIINKETDKVGALKMIGIRMREKKHLQKNSQWKERGLNSSVYSKGANRLRNEGKYNK